MGSIDDELGRFDWSRIQTYQGYAEMVPHAVRGLVAAPDTKEAVRLGRWIERILLSVAGPCEGCTPVATVLVATLPEMTPAGRSVALDLLSLIGAAEITGPAHEQIGAVDVAEIRQAVAAGFRHYVAVLQTESASETDLYSCIDLMGILAFDDPSLTATASTALKGIRTGGRDPSLAVAIENTLDDLTRPSSNS
ncbi:hypothetical protein [Micromonospora antibiotica]|uniref:Uncharacterized protein n=1 Tax=Micromonospora antibiotica TaxID=2807623 RepID=A0ABS3V382_9ACTN|nr:hypothetical protein [Micromonospora antibiotica]MBO4160077.1 hypothetical protein [Micromonospora antibiotica]